MANQDAYTPIATQTVSGSSTSSVTFSSISGSYTDLILIINGATSDSATNNFRVRFNSDSATNYSATRLLGDGSSTSTATGSNNYMMLADINNALFVSKIHILNYSNTNIYKTALSRTGNASAYLGAYVGLWRNTSAINQIDILTQSAAPTIYWASGSTFTLYGITAA